MRQSPERYAPEFKLGVVQRMSAGEVPAAVAKETGVPRRLLYQLADEVWGARTRGFAALREAA